MDKKEELLGLRVEKIKYEIELLKLQIRMAKNPFR